MMAAGPTSAARVARDFIRVYVERGDSLESLVAGGMAVATRSYHAQIGGYLFPRDGSGKPQKRLGAHQIGVSEAQGQACFVVFSLDDIYREIQADRLAGTYQSAMEMEEAG